MKKILFIFTVFATISCKKEKVTIVQENEIPWANDSIIIAGNPNGIGISFSNLPPDTLRIPPIGIPGINKKPIDINKDGIIDFEIVVSSMYGPGSTTFNNMINCFGNNRVMHVVATPNVLPIAADFKITTQQPFVPANVLFRYVSNGLGVQEFGLWKNKSNHFIATLVFANGKKYLGWIGVDVKDGKEVIIKNFACTSGF